MTTTGAGSGGAPAAGSPGRWVAAAELDPRLLGMLGASAALWIALDVAADGTFLTARNLYNLAVQSSVVGVMATGMVLVIVARHIDLSVGSLLGLTGMLMAALQAEVFRVGAAWNAPLSLACGLAVGAGLGAWQGWWVAHRGVPAFVVTLAGLLMFRGGAYLITDGRTVSPLEPSFQVLGGGITGSLGAELSLSLGALAIAGVVAQALARRASRRRHGIPLLPMAAEIARVVAWVAAITAFVAVMNAYEAPRTHEPRGIPVPVLVLIVVAVGMNAVARRTRLGRAVFAMGGNPEAAALAGIDVRRVTIAIFALMGALASVGAAITVARLNAGANSIGTLAELSVIAAAVIGGTSLSGGVGSVGGAILGAVLMQSLDNGMVLLGVSSALRQVGIGAVLLLAVWIDGVYRRRGTS